MHLVKEKLVITDAQKLEVLTSKMSQIKDKFVREFGEFTTVWITERHEKIIGSIPEITRNLEDQELAEINDMVKEIAKTASEKAKDLANKVDWWHENRNEIDHDYYKKMDNLFGDEYRRILGGIGSPLQEFDYLPKQKMPKFGFSFYRDRSNRHRYIFVDPVDWSNKLKRLLDNYNDCFHSALKF